MPKGGIDNDRDHRFGMLLHEGQNSIVQLSQTGSGSTLGSQIRAVNDDMFGSRPTGRGNLLARAFGL